MMCLLPEVMVQFMACFVLLLVGKWNGCLQEQEFGDGKAFWVNETNWDDNVCPREVEVSTGKEMTSRNEVNIYISQYIYIYIYLCVSVICMQCHFMGEG